MIGNDNSSSPLDLPQGHCHALPSSVLVGFITMSWDVIALRDLYQWTINALTSSWFILKKGASSRIGSLRTNHWQIWHMVSPVSVVSSVPFFWSTRKQRPSAQKSIDLMITGKWEAKELPGATKWCNQIVVIHLQWVPIVLARVESIRPLGGWPLNATDGGWVFWVDAVPPDLFHV